MNQNIEKKSLHDIIKYNYKQRNNKSYKNYMIYPVEHERRKNSNSDILHGFYIL